eukprot:scaffold1314_cov386-Pavlova_lutheri.AAC.39
MYGDGKEPADYHRQHVRKATFRAHLLACGWVVGVSIVLLSILSEGLAMATDSRFILRCALPWASIHGVYAVVRSASDRSPRCEPVLRLRSCTRAFPEVPSIRARVPFRTRDGNQGSSVGAIAKGALPFVVGTDPLPTPNPFGSDPGPSLVERGDAPPVPVPPRPCPCVLRWGRGASGSLRNRGAPPS